jgi:hypothetical protein
VESFIGHYGYGAHFQPAVGGGNYLGHGAHAHHVGARHAQKFILGRRFKVGPLHAHIHARVQRDIVPLGNVQQLAAQLAVIGLRHIRKTGAQPPVVFAPQGIFGLQVYVVGNQHQLPRRHSRIYASCGVGYKQVFSAQHFHHVYGKNHLLHTVPLVVVKTPVHHQHFFVVYGAKNKAAPVAFHR